MSKQPTIEQFQAWAKEHASLALTVCKAQAMAELKRKAVDAYILPLFYSFHFENSPMIKPYPNTIVDHPDKLYLCADEEKVAAYYTACDAEHRKHGFTGPAGHCLALVMEHLHIQAENVLLEAGQELFGLTDAYLTQENRKKMLDLLLGACLKAAKGEFDDRQRPV